jgi:hypothetical protein
MTTDLARLPHGPYITAVLSALTAAGLDPASWWATDTETNPYDDGTDMCAAILLWDADSPAVDTARHPDGIVLVWQHPADSWQWAVRSRHGALRTVPNLLPHVGLYADPDAVATAVRALLDGRALPKSRAADWSGARRVQAAVDAWSAA